MADANMVLSQLETPARFAPPKREIGIDAAQIRAIEDVERRLGDAR
jgi:hypothetical protein